VHGLLNPTPCH
jgi:hypothetical protein